MRLEDEGVRLEDEGVRLEDEENQRQCILVLMGATADGKKVLLAVQDDLHDIWMAETRASAEKAFDTFLERYAARYEAACECLRKDRDVLLMFYDFPAEHGKHLRTTKPIESTFATIRLRHPKTKGSGSRRNSLAMMLKLAQSAEKRWRRLNGHERLISLLQGVKFVDGVQEAA